MNSTLPINLGSLPNFNLIEISIRLNWLTNIVWAGFSIKERKDAFEFWIALQMPNQYLSI